MSTKTIATKTLALLYGCFLFSLAACSLNERGPLASWESGVLRVGVTPNYPGLIHKEDETGLISGFEADCAALLARRLHSRLQFVELEWEEQIPALERKEVDIIMSAMSITEMRKLRVAFSEPYLTISQMALTTQKWAEEFPSAQAILTTGKAIGVEKGTTGDIYVQRYCLAAEPFFFSSPDAAIKALRDKRIALFIHDGPVLGAYAASNKTNGLVLLPTPLTSEELAWAIRSDEPDLLKTVNSALAAWKEDGVLQGLLKKWLPQ
ncbi:MAG: transporter substrate-binding domain-containing protein [Desulfobulbaceae bacterium]|nr:transporter substrate-binding domain-containing protein [Desulfobulbaceae bacterium]HIJ90176.1 transporter substrate-binding domain-containing protein [Deltaproteobacteria bacterium]